MPSPSSSLSTQRPDLAGSMLAFDLEMALNGFVGLRIAPAIESARKAGTFGKIPVEQLLKARVTLRSPGSPYSRGNFTFTPVTFSCDEHGAEEPVDDTEATIYADYFDAELVAAQRARDSVLRNFEIRVAALVSDTAVWTGASLTTAVSTPWTTTASATPVADVTAAVNKVYDASGLVANALIVSWKRFQSLRNCAEIVDRVKYSGLQDPTRRGISAQALAAVFDLEEVIVVGAPKDTAIEGQTASIGSIWTDSRAMVCRVARTNDVREPCIARTIHFGADGSTVGGTMETYRDEAVRSNIVRNRMDTEELVMYTQAGHLLTSV